MSAARPEREPALPPKSPDSGKDPMTAPAIPAATPARTSGRPAGAKQLTVWLDSELHLRMSRLKVETGQDLKSQIEEAVRDFLAKKGF